VSCDSPTTPPFAAESDEHLLLRRALGRTVRRLRRDEEVSQADFAARAGLAANHLGEIERSERGLMLQTIMALASALDMDVSELLARAEALARTQTVGHPKA
jgi:transcriptional regulator with XRE-family HTH domain